VCVYFIFVCVCVRIWQFVFVSANDYVKHITSKMRYALYKKMKITHVRIHIYKYTEHMFAINLPHRNRKPKYITYF